MQAMQGQALGRQVTTLLSILHQSSVSTGYHVARQRMRTWSLSQLDEGPADVRMPRFCLEHHIEPGGSNAAMMHPLCSGLFAEAMAPTVLPSRRGFDCRSDSLCSRELGGRAAHARQRNLSGSWRWHRAWQMCGNLMTASALVATCPRGCDLAATHM
jgi:hypothetical protein